nr:MAG TPA: hypothetical protein [Caudoviricetes sp.]
MFSNRNSKRTWKIPSISVIICIHTNTYIAKCPEITFICVLRRFLTLSL